MKLIKEELPAKHKCQIKGDFYGVMLSAHGYRRKEALNAPVATIKDALLQVKNLHRGLFQGTQEEFMIAFRSVLSKEYKAAGLSEKLKD